MSEITNAQNRAYHHKHDYGIAYKNDPYDPYEDLLIWKSENPQTKEHITLAEVAKILGRSLDGIETRKKWLRKNRFRIIEIIDSPDNHYAKLEKMYVDYINGRDRANISTIS